MVVWAVLLRISHSRSGKVGQTGNGTSGQTLEARVKVPLRSSSKTDINVARLSMWTFMPSLQTASLIQFDPTDLRPQPLTADTASDSASQQDCPGQYLDMYQTTMDRIWGWMSYPKVESFRVRIKLNSEEAIWRFIRSRQVLHLRKQQIIDIGRQAEQDGQLENALDVVDLEILISIIALRAYGVGERKDLGEAVLTFEELLSQAKDLLDRTQQAIHSHRGIPPGFHQRAKSLASKLQESTKLLLRMREAIREEARTVAVTGAKVDSEDLPWHSWMARLWGTMRRRNSPSGERVASEEHHEREHLFTGNGWANRRRCACLDYR